MLVIKLSDWLKNWTANQMAYNKRIVGRGGGQVVSVLVFPLRIRVIIPLTPTDFSVKFVFKKNENEQNRGRGWPILN